MDELDFLDIPEVFELTSDDFDLFSEDYCLDDLTLENFQDFQEDLSASERSLFELIKNSQNPVETLKNLQSFLANLEEYSEFL